MEYIINRSREAINKNPAFHTFAINKRTTAGMIIEWRAHNMLCYMHCIIKGQGLERLIWI